MSNYATIKELKVATDVDASNIAAKNDFIALKVEVDKLDINMLAWVKWSQKMVTKKKPKY